MNNFTVAYIKALVLNHFKGDTDKVKLWLNTPNPNLGEVSPNKMIELGREHKLLQFVQAQIKENLRA